MKGECGPHGFMQYYLLQSSPTRGLGLKKGLKDTRRHILAKSNFIPKKKGPC